MKRETKMKKRKSDKDQVKKKKGKVECCIHPLDESTLKYISTHVKMIYSVS